MNEATKKMVQGWVNDYRGDTEKAAKYLQRQINCSIKEARELVRQATK